MNAPANIAAEAPVLALGLMSGTSLDGIDAALVETDGIGAIRLRGALTVPYENELRTRLRRILGRRQADGTTLAVERDLTLAHAAAVRRLLARCAVSPRTVRVIGFHGHTLYHAPERGETWQLGDGILLAGETGIDVVCDFRSADVAAGGEGAPLVPVFHAALAAGLERPLAVLNLGGVANVTWIGPGDELLAFDTGPGNALIDDWVVARTGAPFDRDGGLAARGRVDEAYVAALLGDPYFSRRPPKSLDRNAFARASPTHLSTEDGAATLTAFTAAAVARAVTHFPRPARRWLVTGGGRHNASLMAELANRLEMPVEPVEAIGWDGDALEAEAFAFLAVRALRGLPLSYPATTGVSAPCPGGRLCPAPAKRSPDP